MNTKYSDEEIARIKTEIKNIVFQYPNNFSSLLKHPSKKHLLDFINLNTSPYLNDPFYTMATKCYWILNDIKDWNDIRVQCQHCHKPLKHKNARVFRGYIRPHCNVSCSQSDKKVCSKIIAKKQKKYGSACNVAKGKITMAIKRYTKMLNNEYEILLTPLDEYLKYYVNNKKYNLTYQCKKCGTIFISHSSAWIDNKHRLHNARCYHCYPTVFCRSKAEIELYNFCKALCDQNNLFIKNNDKSLYYLSNHRPVEFDIHIPKLKLLIEFNGTYYHSIEFIENQKIINKEKNKHCIYLSRLDKTIIAESIGYQLIYIEEHLWNYHKNEIKNFLLQKITNTISIEKTKNIIYLDRSIHNKMYIPNNYVLIKETKPSLITVNNKFHYYDCGKLIYQLQCNMHT